MALEHVALLEGRIIVMITFTDYESILVPFHPLDLLVTGRFCTQHVPALIYILEEATITSEFQNILVLEASSRDCDDCLPHEEAHKVQHCTRNNILSSSIDWLLRMEKRVRSGGPLRGASLRTKLVIDCYDSSVE